MTRLDEVAWPGIPNQPLLVVPLGSTEQHGPHLPFTVDALVAEAVARAAGERLGAVVAPVLAYGSSGEHQQFTGTLSIGQDALRMLLIELVRSARTWASRVVLLTGHGGNVPVLSEVVPMMRGEKHDVAWLGLEAPVNFPLRDAHAGRIETSLMLHLAPDSVGEYREVHGSTALLTELMPLLRAGGVRAVSPTGVLGDPRGATQAEGEKLLRALIDDVVARVEVFDVDERGSLRRTT